MRHSREAATEENFLPYRHLAIRVLTRALLDVMNADGASADRESARIFLNGSGMLLHWCQVAALNPTVIVRLAEKLDGNSRPLRAGSAAKHHSARDGSMMLSERLW